MNHCVQELSYYSQQGKQIVQMLLYYVVKLIPCSGLVGITEIPNWELGISVFPSGLCLELLDDTNDTF